MKRIKSHCPQYYLPIYCYYLEILSVKYYVFVIVKTFKKIKRESNKMSSLIVSQAAEMSILVVRRNGNGSFWNHFVNQHTLKFIHHITFRDLA